MIALFFKKILLNDVNAMVQVSILAFGIFGLFNLFEKTVNSVNFRQLKKIFASFYCTTIIVLSIGSIVFGIYY